MGKVVSGEHDGLVLVFSFIVLAVAAVLYFAVPAYIKGAAESSITFQVVVPWPREFYQAIGITFDIMLAVMVVTAVYLSYRIRRDWERDVEIDEREDEG